MWIVSGNMPPHEHNIAIKGPSQGCHTGCPEANGRVGGRAGGLAHYAGLEPSVLDIFSEYFLKIP
jgi:hypothetical protein